MLPRTSVHAGRGAAALRGAMAELAVAPAWRARVVVARRPLHATAAQHRTQPPMIAFRYGHNKGGAAAAAAPAAKAEKPKKAKAASKPATAGPSFEDTPIAGDLLQFGHDVMAYKNATPHTYLDTQVDVTSLLELVGELQAQDPEVCMTDVVLRAAGVALGKVPEANVAHTGNGVLQDLPAADIALVTRGETGVVGLGVIPAVDESGLLDVSAARRQLASGGAAGRVGLGVVFAGDGDGVPAAAFRTILAPNVSAVLTVGGTAVEVGADGEGAPCLRSVLTLSLTADAFAMDAYVASAFLQAMREVMEGMPGAALASAQL